MIFSIKRILFGKTVFDYPGKHYNSGNQPEDEEHNNQEPFICEDIIKGPLYDRVSCSIIFNADN